MIVIIPFAEPNIVGFRLDGKIDDEDSSIAGKVLARAKSKKKKNTKK